MLVSVSPGRQILRAGGAEVELSTPDAVAAEFGTAAAEPVGRTEYLAALGIRVRSLAETQQCLSSVEGLRIDSHRLVVPADAAFNTAFVFTE